MDEQAIKEEWLMCEASPLYFIHTYCQVYDGTLKDWIPFHLWPGQARTLRTFLNNRLVVILKARQLGISWLVLAFALWLLLFRPGATVLVFSRRDDEATYLLGDERLRGMYNRLPEFLKVRSFTEDSGHTWGLSNGSIVRAFPTTAGDGYTASLVIADEFDLVPNQNQLMRSVKPTIDGGGSMIMLSRVDKKRPTTEFKQIYRAAKEGRSPWVPVFLPWHVRPSRSPEWYEEQRRDILSRTMSLDDLYEQYPATDTEALAPNSKDKRIPGTWLEQCYEALDPLPLPEGAPGIPELQLYRLPEPGRAYVIGADPAEGNPTSDDSSFVVLDLATGEEVAALAGKYQISTFAGHIDQVGTHFNKAAVMVERNNHGHAVLLWLANFSKLTRLKGTDDKDGWLSSGKGKALMYSTTADAFKDAETILHSFATYVQLASIEGASLLAPEGEPDDRADSYALALVARIFGQGAQQLSDYYRRQAEAIKAAKSKE
jgi:hypothetical protein